MAKLKFTLNKLAKHGFKFTKNTTHNINPSHDLYVLKFKDNSGVSFYTNLDGTVTCFKYSRTNGESPSYFTSIKTVISCLSNKL
jgi:hypothetical protein